MRDRLIELLKKEQEARCKYTREKIQEMLQGNLRECLRTGFEFSADYLLANGVIVPPCKVGGVVYSVCDCINRPEKLFVTTIHQYEKYMSFSALSRSQRKYVFEEADICKTVFLTKEEAEQALKGGEG